MKRFYLLAFGLIPFLIQAQQIAIKGTVRDRQGELLPMASVSFNPDSLIVTSDLEGNFEAKLPKGRKLMRVSYTGFDPFTTTVNLLRDTSVIIVLNPRVDQLKEVVVQADRYSNQDVVASTRTGTHIFTQKEMSAIPVFMGEADVIKTLQLLPGTVRGVEGSSDTFVRGGAADQNLVLLDGAPIYNTSHMLGFMSVFNPDVVDHVEAMNGGFPAEFGGRLSSVLSVNTLSHIPEKTEVTADVGLVSTRVKLEQPILRDKASFWVAGRRTYIDQVVKLINEELPYYFYDLNGKLILHPTKYDQIEINYYGGEDLLDHFRDKNNDGKGMLTAYTAANSTQSFKWNHAIPSGWKNNLSLFRTKFNYRIRNAFEDYSVSAYSEIEDFGFKFILSHDSLWNKTSFSSGVEYTRHGIYPNVINSQGSISEWISSSFQDGRIAHEGAVYAQQEWSVGRRLRFNAGLRGSFALVEDSYYVNPEPRFSARYEIDEDRVIKFSYSRMVQYLHRISNSAVSMPTDIWYPVTDSVRPQTSHQLALAWQKFVPKHKLFFSVEAYHKSMENLIGYEEGTNLFFNNDFASRLIQGRGRSYGLEFLMKKDQGKLTGWISYTLSWSHRQFDELNYGRWFNARYDRRHNGAIVAQYALHERWSASLVWEFISGARFTPVAGQYTMFSPSQTGVDLIPIFTDMNAVKLADAHRLDLGIKYFSKPRKNFQWHVFAGVYNTYNRATPIGIYIEKDDKTNALQYTQPGLFGLLPFISFGVKW